MRTFDHIPTAEFEVLNDVNTIIASVTDFFLQGAKAQAFTEVIAVKGLANNPTALRNYYASNKAVLENYFDQIDTRAVVNLIQADRKLTDKVKDLAVNPYVLVGAGIATGAIVTYFATKKKR